jgi:uncharacterized damage-inducible protein DinB
MPALRPNADEFAPYYGTYVARVPDGPIVETLAAQLADTMALLRPLTDEVARARYDAGKWSVKEVVGHIVDAERVFMYRALTFGRGDGGPLPSFDENAFVPAAGHDEVALPALLDELAAVRASSVALLRHLPREAWARQGIASGKPVTVRALAWIAAGHERHHLAVIRERYLRGA